ncbi:MAG: hypothetical protein H3C47_12070 [Candidatus Cloacimonetes bacterium]|nr:hypothetical protein [Candidatus Cloacimonadota bacterium]
MQSEGEKWLAQKLQETFGIESDPDPLVLIQNAENYLKTELEKLGYFFLGGRTLPYWGPYIYARQENLDYLVELSEGVEPVRVVFMHDFHCMGWQNFATMGHVGTGGWAKEDALYCVASKWNREHDDFLIHYLKHEAQHKRDLRCFPQLKHDQETMEYRAKLSELIYSQNINTLKRFVAEANPDSNAPHSRASAKIAQKLSLDWDIPAIQSRSRELLFESSGAL